MHIRGNYTQGIQPPHTAKKYTGKESIGLLTDQFKQGQGRLLTKMRT